jgi:hypothetical protein
MNSKYWLLIKDYIDERREDLKTGILSPVNEDKSKSKYNDRDLMIKELEIIDEFIRIPERLLQRISNETDISVEDDH